MPEVSWNLDGQVVLVGAGKMGTALLSGWLAAGLGGDDVVLLDPYPSPEALALCCDHAVGLAASVEQLADVVASVLVMAVKPQVMDGVLPTVAGCVGPDTVTLTIAAGKCIATYEQHLPPGSSVVRAMPNTPAAIGRGMTVLCANPHTSATQRALCQRLMMAVGEAGWIADESLMDAVTAVSGSGPAYVFLLTEAMAAAGIKAGLDAELAARLARATVAGSGELLARSPLEAARLRENVTSPGGTTAAALAVLMAQDGLPALMEKAVAAAVARGKALAK